MVVAHGLGPNEALCLLIDQKPQEIVGVASRVLEVYAYTNEFMSASSRNLTSAKKILAQNLSGSFA